MHSLLHFLLKNLQAPHGPVGAAASMSGVAMPRLEVAPLRLTVEVPSPPCCSDMLEIWMLWKWNCERKGSGVYAFISEFLV